MSEQSDQLKAEIAEQNEEAVFFDGHDEDLIGIATRFGMEPVAAYDYRKFIARLVSGGMSQDEAVEWFDFNTIGAWLGDSTPIFITLPPP
jgi:hypothetical protein